MRIIPVNEKGEFKFEITAPAREEIGIIAVEMPNGATAFERVKVRAADKIETQTFSATTTIEKIKNAAVSPFFENTAAILFYCGAAKNVQLAGGMTNWNANEIFMR